MPKVEMDEQMQAFANDVLESIQQAKRGEGRITTSEQINARRGRPVGSVQKTRKSPTTLRLDTQTLSRWRSSGKGWQTRAAAVLATYAP